MVLFYFITFKCFCLEFIVLMEFLCIIEIDTFFIYRNFSKFHYY